nr:protoporphyrinogen oxidase [Microbacterium bovistercoris]
MTTARPGARRRSTPQRVVVIGGGAAGLVAARTCTVAGCEVTVLEAGPTLGGSVARQEIADLVLDAGAESFATRGGAVAGLIDELGLGAHVVWPNAAGAWLHLSDRTVPMPKGGLLGIPPRPLARDVVAAIGLRAAWRAQRDRLFRMPRTADPATLGALVRERMGQAVLDRLVSPVATGVYSSSADDLAVDAIAPGLRAALVRTRSLARAAHEVRSGGAPTRPAAAGSHQTPGTPTTPGSAAGGLRGGMHTLIEALADDVLARGGGILTGTTADALARADDGTWVIHLAGDSTMTADVVVVATPDASALRLLTSIAPALADLDWPAPTRVELATLVLDAPELDAAPRGTGLLVAEDAHDRVAAKALTHATAKWAWLAEAAGAGRHVVRLSYGRAGAGNPAEDLDDAALRTLALRDATALLGTPLRDEQVVGFGRAAWANAVPLAARGQADRIRAVREAVAAAPGLEATGAWLAGTGLASVIPDARAAASRIQRS